MGGLAGSGSDAGGWGEFWAGLVFELAGFGCGESGEFCLDAGDLGGYGDGFEAGLVGGGFGVLGGAEAENVGGLQLVGRGGGCCARWLFFDSMVAWSLLVSGLDRVKNTLRS
ncbi:hypothetical protein O6R08_06145 [Cutibacterium equinum]|uniref:Uncharacterized protein n=1 Tax=Cutibacterium equinum TaxID=3016342 RepID=A0ABY7QXK5_9ACTN|nr:hypothetical protein [Cutibacterium equinum]WCC79139.1 hypothetical protein O6R08_06145 [Cutibacterium equinum]